jgi:hypothetical protein
VEGRLDLLGPDFAAGWAYAGAEPVRVELWQGDAVLATTQADLFRADLKPRRDGACAFRVALPPLTDAIGALARGLRAVAIASDGTTHTITSGHHLLALPVLASSAMLFGARDCASVLADLRLIADANPTLPYRLVYVAQLCDLLRLHIPPDQRPPNFNLIAAEFAERAGRQAAAAHYGRPPLPRPAPATQGPWRQVDIAASYGCDADLAAPLPPKLACENAGFITGGSPGAYLRGDGGLTPYEATDAAARSLWVGLEGFGAPVWFRDAPEGPEPAATRLYLADFEQLRGVADAGGVLVMDQSAEGPGAVPRWVDVLNTALADLGLTESQAILVNQNHAFAATASGGSARFRATTAQTYFLRAAGVFTGMFPSRDAAWAHAEATMQARRDAKAPRKFTCLNFTPRWVRWAVALSLYERGLTGEGFFSFPGTQSAKPTERLHPSKMLPNLARRDAMIGVFDAFTASCPYIVDVDGRQGAAPDFVFPERAARESFLHIVTETEMSSGEVLRITEKVLKPILALQPFIVFGNERSLALLHGMGFKTFGTVFDESYDRIQSYVTRFDAAESLMLDLLARDTAELRTLAERAAPICIHNFLHLVLTWPILIRHGMMSRLMRNLAGLTRPV